MFSCLRSLSVLALIFSLSGCFTVGSNSSYSGPAERPEQLLSYYSTENSFLGFEESVISQSDTRTWKRIIIQTDLGPTTIDYFQRYEENDNLILVFPILGGKNTIFEYFAEYFVENGYDAAIVHRNNDFKDPALFDSIEAVMRASVIRDRVAMDFFEQHYKKTKFGSFGISRGGINVVLTAGVDKRLQANVIALGGEDLSRIIRESNEMRMIKYRNSVMQEKGFSEKEFYTELKKQLKTDPKYLAKYMDARSTLMFLGLLDATVPIQYGIKLRQRLGGPKTIYLFADHYMAAGFSGVAEVASPTLGDIGFPFDYIEGEAVAFYDKTLKGESGFKGSLLPFHILQSPLNFIATIIDEVF